MYVVWFLHIQRPMLKVLQKCLKERGFNRMVEYLIHLVLQWYWLKFLFLSRPVHIILLVPYICNYKRPERNYDIVLF